MDTDEKVPKNRIAELRKEKKISQSKLAKETGLTRQAISLYEIGKREPKLETWKKLADFFDVPVDYLTGSNEDSSINEMVKLAGYLRNSYVHGITKTNSSDMEEIANTILGLIFLVDDVRSRPSGVKEQDLQLLDLLYNLFKKIDLFYADDSANPDNFRNDKQIDAYIENTNKILVNTLKDLSKMKTERYLDGNS